ncbi:MAG: nuclear transport factor 2 family protein [Cytophagaceae bacterium]|nr:nuclear transport factor 2 family protein [Cytophagaceae bacterium]
MKILLTTAILCIALTFCYEMKATEINTAINTEINSDEDKKQIEKVIGIYQKSLATSNSELAASLYTKDAKFMPSGGPSATGTAQIKGSYDYVFSQIQVNINFTIDEVIIIGKYAYVTSTSQGTSLIKSNNQTVSEINRELFVFKKENGSWKIARYMFNKMTTDK